MLNSAKIIPALQRKYVISEKIWWGPGSPGPLPQAPPHNLSDDMTSSLKNCAFKAWQNEETCFRDCFLVLPCFHAARKHKMFLPCINYEQKKILLLGNKTDAGNNASRVAKLGNIGKTCARYWCFWKHVASFCQALKVPQSLCLGVYFEPSKFEYFSQ